MVPREQLLAIRRDIEPGELLDLLRETGFTRLPVFDGRLDRVLGILHTKDLFHLYAKQRVVILMDALRLVFELRPDVSVVDALRQFRRGREHLAIVRGREGPLLGICTLEDEHDEPTPAGLQ